MNPRRPLSVALCSALVLSTAACAYLPHPPRWAAIRPVRPAQTPTSTAADQDYEVAAAAITRRDYALALDLLQVARARRPADVRVLNAFGVVYDKLGRFDLSGRYYSEAKALAPDSPIIANNLAYSHSLQLAQAAEAPMVAAPAPSARPVIALAANDLTPGVIRLQLPTQTAALHLTPQLTRHALVVVNASGVKGGAEPIRLALAQRGWSASKAAATEGFAQTATIIRYAQADELVARALGRTLPMGTQMRPCESPCVGIQLVVGSKGARQFLAARAAISRRS